MSKRSEAVKRWRKNTKRRIIESMGGECCVCHYKECDAAFDLHHLDPDKKDFALGSIRGSSKSWFKIVNELRKCILLCCRCHRELHYGKVKIPKDYAVFDEKYADYKKIEKQEKLTPCIVCGKGKPERQKTCSAACSGKLSRKVDWDSIDLLEMLKVKTQLAIAEELGVSNTAVRKRTKKLMQV